MMITMRSMILNEGHVIFFTRSYAFRHQKSSRDISPWIFTPLTIPYRPHMRFVIISFYSTVALLLRVCFYRAMHFSAKRGIAIACRLSVRLSGCLSVCLSVCNVGEL